MAWLGEPWLLVGLGFGLLIFGGEALVRGAVTTARGLGVSSLLIGLTIVGFGTSTPELLTSVTAALAGSPGLAVGNIVGSNIANLLLVVGLAALLRPMAVEPRGFLRDGLVLLAVTGAAIVFLLRGHIDGRIGLWFLGALALYVLVSFLQERGRAAQSDTAPMPVRRGSIPRALLLTLVGIAITVLGAKLLVDGALVLARQAGVSETLLGLTLVAVGTSLPELVTTVLAAVRRQSEVALGNAMGSNIYNVLGILGVTALVRPIDAPADLGWVDLGVMAASALLLVLTGLNRGRLGRLFGLFMLAGYGGYIAWLAWRAGAF
ncbi:cation:H+ antiporter [Caulobacter ginsengisoli]|uniref:Cation:H+ antiporter n=1 Tax=Caulobacter ginsengisoli TaxID=400775 RepID=A0ABU0IS90_9CAUL|nr:calcium/sodium antiporter [Caulobacter ginsengisoli]MDQ0464870.1 cation:H+ antiporter [Caulobacter ginsengisoli]